MSIRSHCTRICIAVVVVAAGVVTHAMTLSGLVAQATGPGIVTRQLWTVLPDPLNRRFPEAGLGSVSPDGRYFSFMDVATGNLMLHDFQTGDNRQLTSTAKQQPKEYSEDSVISRDGTRVAYAWFVNDGFEVRVLDLNRTNAQPLVLFSNHVAAPLIFPYDWSPDGKWIAVQSSRADRTGQIAMVSTADGTMRVLKSSSEWRRPEEMAFSPDGRYLAYDLGPTPQASQHDVFVIATDGSRETAVVVNPADDVVIGWTPDGKDLLFARDRNGSGGVWAVPMTDGKADGEPRLIKGDISVRPRGLTRSGALCFSATLSAQDIYVASVDLATGKLLVPPARIAGQRLVSISAPSGRRMASRWRTSRAGTTHRSWRFNRSRPGPSANSVPILRGCGLTAPCGHVTARLWSSLAGKKWTGRPASYRCANWKNDAPSGREYERARASVRPVGWSADGRSLYFRRQAEVSILDTQTGRERIVDGVTGMFALSPDARAWAWIDGPAPVHDSLPAGPVDGNAQSRGSLVTLQVMPVESAKPRELIRVSAPEDLRAPTWSPDGRFLMYFKLDIRDPNGTVEVWSIPVEGGTPHKIDLGGRVPAIPGNDADLNKSIRIHPDGRQIAIETMEPKAEVWMMENLLAHVQAGR